MALDLASSHAAAATFEYIATSTKSRIERFAHSLRLALRPFRGSGLPPEIDQKDLGYPASFTGRL
jgi:hypothetical protein